VLRGALYPDPDPAGYPVNLVDPAGSGWIQCIWIRFRSGSGRIWGRIRQILAGST